MLACCQRCEKTVAGLSSVRLSVSNRLQVQSEFLKMLWARTTHEHLNICLLEHAAHCSTTTVFAQVNIKAELGTQVMRMANADTPAGSAAYCFRFKEPVVMKRDPKPSCSATQSCSLPSCGTAFPGHVWWPQLTAS
ncbi:hypothetical protein F7725_004400 [Dissostichus mawsoni]|uniref:Uncharacterized protein n=1 Tax=Dissostichus mawsoni TaxID=36200 RepID=A0A7J5XIL1_DISMA|nr:hypothetical protein F7725_004400 [Dissostichus mawsoni]